MPFSGVRKMLKTLSKIEVSDERSLLDIDLIYDFLHNEARWCKGIPREIVERSIENSLCFGAYSGDEQVGFARMVTDYATFGNLVDVFVLSEMRGLGIARLLLDAINEHPRLQGLRRIMLATSDKQGLYSKFGFQELIRPDIFMEKFDPDVYAIAGIGR